MLNTPDATVLKYFDTVSGSIWLMGNPVVTINFLLEKFYCVVVCIVVVRLFDDIRYCNMDFCRVLFVSSKTGKIF